MQLCWTWAVIDRVWMHSDEVRPPHWSHVTSSQVKDCRAPVPAQLIASGAETGDTCKVHDLCNRRTEGCAHSKRRHCPDAVRGTSVCADDVSGFRADARPVRVAAVSTLQSQASPDSREAHLKMMALSTGGISAVAFSDWLYTRKMSAALNLSAVMVSTLASKEPKTAPLAACSTLLSSRRSTAQPAAAARAHQVGTVAGLCQGVHGGVAGVEAKLLQGRGLGERPSWHRAGAVQQPHPGRGVVAQAPLLHCVAWPEGHANIEPRALQLMQSQHPQRELGRNVSNGATSAPKDRSSSQLRQHGGWQLSEGLNISRRGARTRVASPRGVQGSYFPSVVRVAVAGGGGALLELLGGGVCAGGGLTAAGGGEAVVEGGGLWAIASCSRRGSARAARQDSSWRRGIVLMLRAARP